MRSNPKGKKVQVEEADKDAEIASERTKLLRQVNELNSIIEQCKWNLETLRFKDVERATVMRCSRTASRYGRTPNVEVRLQNDLYKFAGLRCVKFKRQEFVFNFASTRERQKDNTQAVQIFVKNGKGNLGKWVMPMSIDMNLLLTKIPIEEPRNLNSFIKSCKHNVDCYVVRQEQFLSLKKLTTSLKHCTLQTNMGYTWVSLELRGVHDSKNDEYYNLTISLLYRSNEARPYKIEVDTTNRLSDENRRRLKVGLKNFKILDLQTAFNKVLLEGDSAFTWTRMDDSESSPLELNDTSSSEESLLTQLRSSKKKSLKRAKRKRELQQKWNQRKKQRIAISDTSHENDNDDDQSTKVRRTERPRQAPTKERQTEKIKSPLKQLERIEEHSLRETPPINKTRTKLKQTKLNFQINLSESSSSKNNSPLFQTQPRVNLGKRVGNLPKLFTSTPLHHKIKGSKLPSASNRAATVALDLEIDNITAIEFLPKQIAHKSNNSSNRSKDDTSKTSDRTLRSSANSIKSPSQASARKSQRLAKGPIVEKQNKQKKAIRKQKKK